MPFIDDKEALKPMMDMEYPPEPQQEDNVQSLLKKGQECFQFGLFEEAVEIFSQVIEMDPGSSPAYNLRGNVLADLGRWEEALENYDTAIRVDPSNAEAYFSRGNENLDLGRPNLAIEDYQAAARLSQAMAKAVYNEGLAHLGVGDAGQAMECFSRTIEKDPTLARAYCNRGRTYLDKGMPEEALLDLNEAVDLTPYDMAPYHNRAKAYYLLGRLEKASYDLNTFIQRAGPLYESFALDDVQFLESIRDGKAREGLAPPKSISHSKLEKIHGETTVFVDIAGSTEIVNTYGGFHFYALFSVLERIFDGHAIPNGCVYRKGLGDGFMAVFSTCKGAVTACVRAMVELERHNAQAGPSQRIQVRIGMDHGETAVSRNNDRFGIPVNVAKRIEGAVAVDFTKLSVQEKNFPNVDRIFISYIVYKSLAANPEFVMSEIGKAQLRGLSRLSYKIFMVNWKETELRLGR